MVYIYLFIYFLFCSVYLLLYQVMIFMFTNVFVVPLFWLSQFIYLFTYNYILVNSFSCLQLRHERGLKIDVLSGAMLKGNFKIKEDNSFTHCL